MVGPLGIIIKLVLLQAEFLIIEAILEKSFQMLVIYRVY